MPASHTHIFDWWEDSSGSVSLPPKGDTSSVGALFVIGCTPSQHSGNRGLFDRWHTLRSLWADSKSLPTGSTRAPKKVFFGVDTSCHAVCEDEDEGAMPHCPAFAEISECYGSFDLVLLPVRSVCVPLIF